MTLQEMDICGEDVLEDKDCNVEEEVIRSMDIERVKAALRTLTAEEQAIILDFYYAESPTPARELEEKYAMTKSSIYRRRGNALKKLKKILGDA